MTTPVICRLPNHVSDCMMALPALRLLEASGFKPILAGKRWSQDLMAGMQWPIDPIEGHVFEDLERIQFFSNHYGKNPLGLLFPNSFSSALLFRIGRIRSAGFATEGRRLLLDQAIPTPGPMHTVEYFFQLAHHAILLWGKEPAWNQIPENLGLRLLARHHAAARNLLEEHHIPERFALVAPVARGLYKGKKKHWSHFNDLCVFLRENGVEPVIFPSVREEKATRVTCPEATIFPPTTLGNYAALTQLAEIVISNDSGSGHVAVATGATQLMIFGVTDEKLFYPWSPNAHIIGSKHQGWPTLEEVKRKIQSLLSENKQASLMR